MKNKHLVDYDDTEDFTEDSYDMDEADARPRKTLMHMIRRRTQHQKPPNMEDVDEKPENLLDQINF